ncbi:hypothetical protein EMCRGX_G014624 [Ephydatia muelleri]
MVSETPSRARMVSETPSRNLFEDESYDEEEEQEEDIIRDTHKFIQHTHKLIKKLVKGYKVDSKRFTVNGRDLLTLPARDPVKFCLQAMDILFTKEELGTKRFKVTRKRGDREPLPTLDETKVKLIDDAIIQRYGLDEYNRTAAQVRRQANQKCSDIGTKVLKKNKT